MAHHLPLIWLLALACAPGAPVAGSGATSDWEGVPAVFDFDLTIDGDVTWVGSTSLFAIESSGNCTTSWSLAARSTHMRGGKLVLQVTGTDLLDMGTELAPFDARISVPGGHVDAPFVTIDAWGPGELGLAFAPGGLCDDIDRTDCVPFSSARLDLVSGPFDPSASWCTEGAGFEDDSPCFAGAGPITDDLAEDYPRCP